MSDDELKIMLPNTFIDQIGPEHPIFVGAYHIHHKCGKSGIEYVTQMPVFCFFPPEPREPHALLYYVFCAGRTADDMHQNTPVYENELDPVVNFRELFIATAKSYDVDASRMYNYWPEIEEVVENLGMKINIQEMKNHQNFFAAPNSTN